MWNSNDVGSNSSTLRMSKLSFQDKANSSNTNTYVGRKPMSEEITEQSVIRDIKDWHLRLYKCVIFLPPSSERTSIKLVVDSMRHFLEEYDKTLEKQSTDQMSEEIPK